MKKIYVLVLLIVVQSCVHYGEEWVNKEFILKNSSSHTIKVEFFNLLDNGLNTNSSTILTNGSTKSYTIENILSANSNESLPSSAFIADSVKIIFGNVKKVSYTDKKGNFSAPVNRNIFRYGNYEYLGNQRFQFTFTEEDYNNAEDCGGPCE